MSNPARPPIVRGGCLCGAVRYEAAELPIASRACWCRTCQYLGAGSGTVNTWFHSASVGITGDLSDYESVADSGRVMRRRFCPRCGTQVLTQSVARPDLLGVRTGTLDDPELGRPSVTVWTASAPSWACVDPSIPGLPGQPGPVA